VENTKRIEWIDVLRFLGIFSIYLSHLGDQAGYFYPFSFRYQVPLFFFLAGAMENLAKKDTSAVEHFKKKFKGIIMPYFFFGFVSIILIYLQGHANAGIVIETAVQYLLGIRNQLYAPILWFLPCIFVISMIFFLLKKLFKNRWLILLIGLGLFLFTEYLLPYRPIFEPSWFWNIDSALYYFFYYALGYAFFPYVRDLLSSSSTWARLGFVISAAIVSLYAGALLVGKDLVAMAFSRVSNSGPFILMLGALLLIWFSVFIAQMLSSITLFQKIGRDTLYLCGSEQIIRHFTPHLFAIFGWNGEFTSPIGAIIYTFMALLVAKFGIIPLLKYLYNALLNQFSKALHGAPDQKSS